MSRRQFLERAGLLTGAVLLGPSILAACGGDDDDDGGTSAATSTAPAPQGPPIKVGGMVSSSGAQKAVLGGTGTVLEAWAEHVNNTGGL
ncbi:MAG: twin-arginine translocation signal domain-containing protein, partial [Acidimicrobiia bacterium]